jgi:two-component sensor histidine kinase
LFMPLKGQHLGLTSHQKETALKEIGVRIQNLLTVQDSIVNTHTRTHTNKS